MSDVRIPRPPVRDEFRKRLRADLVNEAVALAEERRLHPPSIAQRFVTLVAVRTRPIAVAVTALAILLAGSGAAAAGSLPGDPAFALKRAAEQVELAFAANDDAKVRVLTAQTERRLEELGRSANRPDKAPTASAEYEAAVERLAAAVSTLRTAEPEEKREAVEQVVEAAREKHVPVLETLKERVPEAAKGKIEQAIEQHKRIEEKKQEDRGPRNDGRPSESPRRTADVRSTEQPRVTETPRGGRPSAVPTPRR